MERAAFFWKKKGSRNLERFYLKHIFSRLREIKKFFFCLQKSIFYDKWDFGQNKEPCFIAGAINRLSSLEEIGPYGRDFVSAMKICK